MMKKFIAFISAFVLIFTLAICAGAGSYVRGDADGNGYVDIVDVTVISRQLVELDVPAFFEKNADVDNSGEVEITDATLIQRMIAGISNFYNIGETVVETQAPTRDPDELPFIPKR